MGIFHFPVKAVTHLRLFNPQRILGCCGCVETMIGLSLSGMVGGVVHPAVALIWAGVDLQSLIVWGNRFTEPGMSWTEPSSTENWAEEGSVFYGSPLMPLWWKKKLLLLWETFAKQWQNNDMFWYHELVSNSHELVSQNNKKLSQNDWLISK